MSESPDTIYMIDEIELRPGRLEPFLRLKARPVNSHTKETS